MRLRVTASLLHQLRSYKAGKYIQYSSGFVTLIWHKIFCYASLPIYAVCPNYLIKLNHRLCRRQKLASGEE